MSMRKSKNIEASFVGTVIAAICIIIYFFALVQATVRLYISVEQHRVTSEREFYRLADIATAAGAQGFMDEHFIQAINNSLAASSGITAVIITGPESQHAFERQRGSAITWVNNSPRFYNKFGLSNHRYNMPLNIQNLRNVNIHAVATSFNSAELTRILKETILIILIGFSIAFFTLLSQALYSKAGNKKITYIRETPKEEPRHTAQHVAQHTAQHVADTPSPPPPEKQAEPEPVIILRDLTPKGLYSPRSNIGWEDYIHDRLDSELHRSASTENDLTLFAIELSDNVTEEQYKEAAEETVSFFSSRDLLFEMGKYGFVMIYPGASVETSLEKAQKLHQRICDKLLQDYGEKSLCIGLSSRSGRLLNADRILIEAKEALNRAKRDHDTSIIAFKSDPEKYRKFISSQNP